MLNSDQRSEDAERVLVNIARSILINFATRKTKRKLWRGLRSGAIGIGGALTAGIRRTATSRGRSISFTRVNRLIF